MACGCGVSAQQAWAQLAHRTREDVLSLKTAREAMGLASFSWRLGDVLRSWEH